MITDDRASEMYEALDLFRDRCLKSRRSMVLDDDNPLAAKVWTIGSADELARRFIESPDESKRSFMVKLRDQLDGTSPESLQLLVELMWLHVIVSSFYKPETKRRFIAEIAAMGSAETPPGIYDDALNNGVAHPGTSFSTRRPNQLRLLIRFAQAWLSASSGENERLLEDPVAFRKFVFDLDGVADQTQRHALLHLIHPDSFESILSQYHKADIVQALSPTEKPFDNVDQGLAAIRAQLTPEFGEGFTFYDEGIHEQWSPDGAAEVETDEAAAGALDPDAERKAWLVRGSGGKRVPEWLERGICAIGFADTFPFEITEGLSRDELRTKSEEAGVDVSAGGYNAELGQVWRFTNAIEVGDFVVTVNGQDVYLGVINGSARSVGGRARRETSRSVDWLNEGRPVPRSLVDPALYSKMRTLLTVSDITAVVDSLDELVTNEFRTSAVPAEVRASELLEPPTKALAKELLINRPWLTDVVNLLDEKKQIVLYGPPGTGKTFLAQELADFLTSNSGVTEIVQFHPSYTYEDFFEGYRPVGAQGGAVSFELKPGPLRRIATAAAADPDVPHILIIDEINRANLAKVFGELYFLLEYRGSTITLQYSDDDFSLPENLFVIGTMNTADRSIALVDAAMRRRFYFVSMAPHEEPVAGLLREWLGSNDLPTEVADVLDELNLRIGDPDAAIGPSFLMTPAVDDDKALARIWQHAIIPLLQERFYGTADENLERFALSAILRTVRAAPK